MAHTEAAPTPALALDSIRAAIEVVQRHLARRVVIQVTGAERLLPAARALARSAGLDAHATWSADLVDCRIVIAEDPVADA